MLHLACFVLSHVILPSKQTPLKQFEQRFFNLASTKWQFTLCTCISNKFRLLTIFIWFKLVIFNHSPFMGIHKANTIDTLLPEYPLDIANNPLTLNLLSISAQWGWLISCWFYLFSELKTCYIFMKRGTTSDHCWEIISHIK